jgi:hypothetical protein
VSTNRAGSIANLDWIFSFLEESSGNGELRNNSWAIHYQENRFIA